jgi:hypothetical protein
MSAIQAESTKQGTYGASGTITAANFIDRQGGYKA